MKTCRPITLISLALSLAATGPVLADADALVKRLLAPPKVTTASGISARILVAPGQLYDPLIMLPMGDVVWLNDDGGEEKDKGSRLLAVSASGQVSVLADIGKLLPTVGFDLAPPEFGDYGGQLFSLAQPRVAMPGALENHVVQRIDPAHDFSASIFCTLPEAGAKKISGFGLDARFGPTGSPFAGRFFVVTIYNDAIYEVEADGTCKPFIVFDGKQYSGPAMITFAPDGQTMLVSVSVGVFDISSPEPPNGAIVAVTPDGKIAGAPLFEGQAKPMGLTYAPADFGEFGGQLFFADVGQYQVPVPMTQALQPDGRIFRLDGDGKAHLVAAGLFNPIGVQFVNGKLWVSDISGDFIAGKRELPDGFIVEIELSD